MYLQDANDNVVPGRRNGNAYRRRSVPTRTVILDAARKILKRVPYEAFSLLDVAEESGFSRRTIYNQFADKIDLYRTSRESLMRELGFSVPTSIEIDLPIEEALRVYFKKIVDIMGDERNTDLMSSIIRDGETHEWLPQLYKQQVVQPIKRTLELFLYHARSEGRLASGDISRVAENVINMLYAIAAPVPMLKTITGSSASDMDDAIETVVSSLLVRCDARTECKTHSYAA